MPFYTASFTHGTVVLRYARQYHGQYNHGADNQFRADALENAAHAFDIPQNQVHGNFQNVQALNPHHEYEMI